MKEEIARKKVSRYKQGFTPSLENGMAPPGPGHLSLDSTNSNPLSGVSTQSRQRSRVTMPFFSAGFTLVELLVAVSLFLVIMTVSLGAVVSVLDAGRKSRAIKDVMTNLNFALEVMAREIKFGKNYACAIPTCSNGGSQVSFTSSSGASIIYRLNNNQIEKSTNGGSTYLAITAPEITVQNLKFYLFGYQAADGAQPRVLILIQGYAGNKPSAQSSFILQTTVSQRQLDS